MATSTTYRPTDTETYWKQIENVSDEVKLRLISLLSESLIKKTHTETSPVKETQIFLDRYYGAWRGDESDKTIISTIRESHSCKPPVNFD